MYFKMVSLLTLIQYFYTHTDISAAKTLLKMLFLFNIITGCLPSANKIYCLTYCSHISFFFSNCKYLVFFFLQPTYKSANSKWHRNRPLSVLHIGSTARWSWKGEDNLFIKKSTVNNSNPQNLKVCFKLHLWKRDACIFYVTDCHNFSMVIILLLYAMVAICVGFYKRIQRPRITKGLLLL